MAKCAQNAAEKPKHARKSPTSLLHFARNFLLIWWIWKNFVSSLSLIPDEGSNHQIFVNTFLFLIRWSDSHLCHLRLQILCLNALFHLQCSPSKLVTSSIWENYFAKLTSQGAATNRTVWILHAECDFNRYINCEPAFLADENFDLVGRGTCVYIFGQGFGTK